MAHGEEFSGFLVNPGAGIALDSVPVDLAPEVFAGSISVSPRSSAPSVSAASTAECSDSDSGDDSDSSVLVIDEVLIADDVSNVPEIVIDVPVAANVSNEGNVPLEIESTDFRRTPFGLCTALSLLRLNDPMFLPSVLRLQMMLSRWMRLLLSSQQPPLLPPPMHPMLLRRRISPIRLQVRKYRTFRAGAML